MNCLQRVLQHKYINNVTIICVLRTLLPPRIFVPFEMCWFCVFFRNFVMTFEFYTHVFHCGVSQNLKEKIVATRKMAKRVSF